MLKYASLDFHNAVVSAAEQLRPLPTSAVCLAGLAADPECDMDEVIATVQRDPLLVASLLREANSVASAARGEVSTIDAAVVRLGLGRVVAVAVQDCLQDVVGTPLTGYGLIAEAFRRRSVACSYVAEVVRATASVRLGPELVTAALLHDIGMALLSDELSHAHFVQALDDLGDAGAAERLLIDIDHATVGFVLAQHWGLPDAICDAIKGHHLLDGDESDLARAVHLSDVVTHELISDNALMFSLSSRFAETVTALGVDAHLLLERAARKLESCGFEIADREGESSLLSSLEAAGS